MSSGMDLEVAKPVCIAATGDKGGEGSRFYFGDPLRPYILAS